MASRVIYMDEVTGKPYGHLHTFGTNLEQKNRSLCQAQKSQITCTPL